MANLILRSPLNLATIVLKRRIQIIPTIPSPNKSAIIRNKYKFNKFSFSLIAPKHPIACFNDKNTCSGQSLVFIRISFEFHLNFIQYKTHCLTNSKQLPLDSIDSKRAVLQNCILNLTKIASKLGFKPAKSIYHAG